LRWVSLRVSLQDLQIYLLTFNFSKNLKKRRTKADPGEIAKAKDLRVLFWFFGKKLSSTHQRPHN